MNGGRGGKGGEVLFVPKEDRVVSVRPDGEAHVFDVVCEDPHRNFVANGIIVHNCGKTVQTLAAVPDNAPVLVIGPAVAKGVWLREAKRWRPDLLPVVLSGRESFRWPRPGELLVTNYDILPTLDAIKALDFAPPGIVLVFDEAHRLKGSKSQRTERSRLIAQRARDAWGRVWLLTGTPIENKPPELWNVLKVADIEREAFESWKKFVELFGGYKDKYNGMHWSEHPDPSVPVRLQRVMLRHRRVDVLPDLPPTMFQNLEVSITEKMRVELDKLVFRLSDFCDVTDPYAILEATRHEKVAFETVGNIRSLLALAKTPSMLEYIEEFEEAREPVIIMSAHLAPLKALRGRDGWNILDGSTKSSDRTDMEERFQRGELLGLACSIRAAGVALTLTRSAQVVFVDESWTPSENEQATDRVRRIGQTRGVVVTRLFADHNIDRHVLKVLGRKERLIARTLGEVKEETHG